MKALSAHLVRKWAFYSLTILSTTTLISFQNCGKVKFNVDRNQLVVPQSCGTISMAPQNGLSESTSVAFTVVPANGITISDLQWTFTKGASAAPIYASTTNPAIHTFGGPSEGVGDYLATATFTKSDGNSCELAKSFQIISGDLCVDPSGISGPAVGFVGEETSPFSIDNEDCYVGTVVWDMDTNGIAEYNNTVSDSVTHTYNAPGTYTVTATVIDGEDNSQTILTHTIVITHANCANGATNPPTCTACTAGQSLVGGQCVPNCTNGAINPPQCTNCPALQTLVGGQCIPSCTNGTTNPPTCTTCPSGQSMVGGQCVANCTNGATNPPQCTTCPSGQSMVGGQCVATCSNGANNPPQCTTCPAGQNMVGGQCVATCSNGATNPPTCTTCAAGQSMVGGQCVANCVNGATNPPQCTTCPSGQSMVGGQCVANCTNGATNPPACTSCTSGQTLVGGQCIPNCTNGANNPPQCNTCPAGRILISNQCIIPANCTVGATQVLHGETRSFFDNSNVGCGIGQSPSCASQNRTCYNGTMSGGANFAETACMSVTCPTTCSNGAADFPACTTCPSGRIMVGGQCIIPSGCNVNGTAMAHGETRSFYPASSVACGGACTPEARTCNNGVVSGNATSTASTCSVGACTCVNIPRRATCFVAGTPVTLADGSTKAIDKIVLGDKVLILDEETGAQKVSPVTELKHHKARSQMMYSFEFSNGRSFTVTGEHLIFTVQEGYVPAMHLYQDFKERKATRVLDIGYNSVTIKSATAKIESVPTYNIHVEGISDDLAKYGRNGRGHNYYANGIVAHNRKWCCIPNCENTAIPPENNCCTSEVPMRLPGTGVNCLADRLEPMFEDKCGVINYEGCSDPNGSPECN